MGDMLGQTVKAAALKVSAAAASEEAARQLHPLVQSSAEALRTAGQPVTAEAVKASLQLQIPGIRKKTLKKVGCPWHARHHLAWSLSNVVQRLAKIYLHC